MKTLNILRRLQTFAMVAMTTLTGALVWDQDKTAQLDVNVDVNKGTETSNWMTNPLVWVIGALVLILVVVLAARGASNK